MSCRNLSHNLLVAFRLRWAKLPLFLGGITLALLAAGTSLAQVQHPTLDTMYYYRIVEPTRNEVIARGSDGNVLRWTKTNGDEQKWMFTPARKGGWHIINVANGEYMTVEGAGNVRTWPYNPNDDGQRFAIQRTRNGKLRLQERTQRQYVSVGSNGNVLRWSRSGDDTQAFALEPILVGGRKPQGRPADAGASPQRLQAFPRFSNLDDPANNVFLGEDVIAASAVVDSKDYGMTSRILQARDYPYYAISRRQYFKRGTISTDDVSMTVVQREGIESEDFKSAGFSIGVEAKQETKVAAEFKGVSAEASRSVTLSAAYEQLETWSRKSSSYTEERTSVEATNEGFQRAAYQLVDEFVLSRIERNNARTEVTRWTVTTPGYSISKRRAGTTPTTTTTTGTGGVGNGGVVKGGSGTGNAAMTATGIVGTFERTPVENAYHSGTISAVPNRAGAFRWTNRAGVSWSMTLASDGKTLVGGSDNPYRGKNFTLQRDAQGRVTGVTFLDELYRKVGNASVPRPRKPELTSQRLVGTFSRMPAENGWHVGSLTCIGGNSMLWTNRAGVKWRLTFNPATKTLVSGSDCPYPNEHFQVKLDGNGQVNALVFLKETYRRQQ